MGILAVAEVAHLVAAQGEVLRQRCRRVRPAKVLADGGVVGGGVTEGYGGKVPPERRRNAARVLERVEDGRVIARPHHRKHVVMVLRRRAQQRHTPDVDRLDRLRVAGPGRHRLHEGVEIDDHEIDELQLTLGELLKMTRLVAARQDAGVHVGVQRLYPPIEHLGEPRQFLKRVNRDVRLAQHPLGAAGRVHRDGKAIEPAGEFDESALVRDTEERVHNGNGRGRPASCRTTSASKPCSSAWMRSRRLSTVSSGRTSTRRWARIGPWSTSLVTTWIVQPVSATPALSAIRTASMVPANSGSREGWMLMMRPSNSRVKARSRIASYPAQTTSSTPCWRSTRTISQSRALRSGKAPRRNTWREMPAFFAISSAGHSRLAHTITTRAG